ncbi:MAG: 30S ribosomal protein S15 [Candidatus Paceibacterota bacterium]
MTLTRRQKQYAIKDTKLHSKDTGSPEAQISILTKKIKELTKHLKKHKKDTHSRKGLLQMVADRRKHIRYLREKDLKRYNKLAKKIGLKEIES